MLHRAWLFQQGANVLFPVIDFFLFSVTSRVIAHRLVVVVKLDVAKEKLCLDDSSRQDRRQPIAVGINHRKSVFVYAHRFILEDREQMLRQFQQAVFVRYP